MKNLQYIIFILILTIALNNTGNSQCVDESHCFNTGEKITYEVAYNWGFIWVDGGEVFFKVDTITRQGKNQYHFKSYGESYRFYDWIFKVRDHFESIVDPQSFRPQWFSRNTSEGGFEVNNSYIFDYDAERILSSTQNSDKPQQTDSISFPDCTFDVLTAIYYARNIDFSNLKKGDSIPVNFIIDGGINKLHIKYLEEARVENRDGKKYDCIKFSAQVVAGTIFKEKEDIMVWVTNDKNRIPILVEAKILIGSIKAYMTSYTGLKYDLEAEVVENP